MARSLTIAAVGLVLCADQALAQQQRCPEAKPGTNCCDWQVQLAPNREDWATVPLPLPPAEIKEVRGPPLRSGAQVYQVCVTQVQGQAGERFIESALAPPTRVDPPTIIAAWLTNHVNKYAEIHRFVKIALDFKGAHEANDAEIAKTIESFYIEERKLLSKIIREGVKQGLFQPVDPNRMAQFISTYLDGCMVRSVILSDFDLQGAVRDLHRRALDMLGYSGKATGKRRRR